MTHPQGFRVLLYVGRDGNSFKVWNSRDAAAPQKFQYGGMEYELSDWGGDSYEPNHLPVRGELIFVAGKRGEPELVTVNSRWLKTFGGT